jgi:hypothetical protein
MKFKYLFTIVCFSILFFSCSEDTDTTVARNLQGYLDENSGREIDTLIAFAANAEGNTALNYIFYYPEIGATDIRYYETTNTSADKTDYNSYRRQSLITEAVFGGKLQRFSRSGTTETWCLVTYIKDGKLHISEQILLKNVSKTTQYSNDVSIAYKTNIEPNFTWEDGTIDENVRYFQVISNEEDDFKSGTFTKNKFFQYYDESSFESTINLAAPESLVEDEVYNFTMMGISEDNWVNLIIKEQFIPKNLEEYVAENSDKTLDTLIAFASSANGNKEQTYIYFNSITGAFNYRYYETENTGVDKTDFSNYKRRSLPESTVFGSKLRRFTHASSDEVWCLVTYITEGKLHISEPIRTKNNSKATQYSTEVEIIETAPLMPIFNWTDGTFAENINYFQAVSKNDNTFLSGTFTTEKSFQYYNEANIIGKIHTVTPESLVTDDTYKFALYGISEDNWVNLIIQTSFVAR